MMIEKNVKEKYSKRGKPTEASEKGSTTDFHISIKVSDIDNDIYENWLRQESCFVLVTNVPKERLIDEAILREYKRQ